jgi:UDP-N-acetyl-2-amino-2-deoxyglucuronate dehydrogenase
VSKVHASQRPGHAIIGCGRVAPNHVDGFRSLADWDILWACDRELSAAKGFGADFEIAKTTAAAGDVFADAEVTSVSITVDHAQHARLAEEALLAGKHVLVEKPLALKRHEAERVVALAAQRGLVLSVVSQHRYDPLVLAVASWMRDGLLGKPVYAQISLEACREPSYYTESYWRGTWAGEGGSALINQGYHCLDVTRQLCGELEVKAAVMGRGNLGGAIETEDTISALLLADGTPVTLNVTVGSTTMWRTRLEIIGSSGSVCLDLDHPGTLHRATGNEELTRRASAFQADDGAQPTPGINYYGISHRRQIADFARAVVTGAPPAVGPEVAVGMVGLLEEIYAAAGGRR